MKLPEKVGTRSSASHFCGNYGEAVERVATRFQGRTREIDWRLLHPLVPRGEKEPVGALTTLQASNRLIQLEGLLGLPKGSRAKWRPGFDPLPISRVSATHPNPPWHPKPSRLWPPVPPILHPTIPRTARSLTVVPLARGQRYYGEAPVRLRGSSIERGLACRTGSG
jgi:hypothetical protein